MLVIVLLAKSVLRNFVSFGAIAALDLPEPGLSEYLWLMNGIVEIRGALLAAALSITLSSAVPATNSEALADEGGHTILGIEGTRFTLNGKPTFLLGLSYYGGLGASEEFIQRDLDDAQRHGFNWLRVWATWGQSDDNVSAVTAEGGPREPFFGKLKQLVAECDRRGLAVDVTLTRGRKSPTAAAG